MNLIRPLRREDLPQVASLIEVAFRSGARTPARGLTAYLERLLLDHPWADPEIPSLVTVDDQQRIVGCLGSHVRRFRFQGRPIRMAAIGQLVSDPDVRRQAVGAFLMKRYLEGPQDVTFTDTGSETVRRMWEGLGGVTVYLGRIGWLRLFRPSRFASEFLLRDVRPLRRAAMALSAPVDALTRLATKRLDTPNPHVSAEPLTPELIVENLSAIADDARLRPDYDDRFLEWLFRELAAVSSRVPAGFLIRNRNRVPIGWYLYFLRSGGVSQVLQVAGKERDIEGVLDHLFHHAQANGSSALQGRVEPSLVEALSRRGCILHPSGHRVLVHTNESEILHAIDSGGALLSRLDGDWWTGLHLELSQTPPQDDDAAPASG